MKKIVYCSISSTKKNKDKKFEEAKTLIDNIYKQHVGKVIMYYEVENESEESDFNNFIIIDNDKNRPIFKFPEDTPSSPPTTNPPTEPPTEDTSDAPTDTPTDAPVNPPVDVPTDAPVNPPTELPTEKVTEFPTDAPNEDTKNYFRIKSLVDDNKVSFTNNIIYKINNGNWNNLNANTEVTINTNDEIKFIGNLIPSENGIGTFNASGQYEVKGNIMSLLYSAEFEDKLVLNDDKVFYMLFYNSTTLVKADELLLPAMSLSKHCYGWMFYGCTSLTHGPELPAAILSEYCYVAMFQNCTSLLTGPNLYSTSLARYCYQSMFYNCTSMTKCTDKLPAKTLAEGAYYHMFINCSSLKFIVDELPATDLIMSCYAHMFEGCSSLLTAPKLPATTLTEGCYQYLFKDCTSLTTAPDLMAKTLLAGCYYRMFQGCKKLNYIKMLGTTLNTQSTYKWVENVAANGTFVKDENMTSLSVDVNGIPKGWAVINYKETNLITFYIDDIEYQYEEGMTWEEWINSEYNINGYICAGYYIHIADNDFFTKLYANINSNILVDKNDYIIEKNGYTFKDDVVGNTTFEITYNDSTQTQVMTISPIQGTDGKLPDSYEQDIFGTYLSPLQVYQYGIIDENGEYIVEPKWDGTPIDIVVEEGITEIPVTTFMDCDINSLTLPESLISGTFERIFGCDILEIPANTIYIGGFSESDFKHIIIGENVQELGNYIFDHCLYLETATILSKTPPTVGSFSWAVLPKNFEIYVPEESIELYKNHQDWQEVVDIIKPIPKQTNLITFYIDDIEYQYEEGMTWEEWINSEYNYNNYVIFENHIRTYNGYNASSLYINGYSIIVNKNDYIDVNNTYKFHGAGN